MTSSVMPTNQLPVQSVLQPKLLRINDEIKSKVYEREELIWGMLVALLSRLHLLEVGTPGTAKSMSIDMLAARISDARYFSELVHETTTPETIIGAPDIPGLVNEGRARRVIDGMLPEADIAFLDEVFNASGGLLHSLLGIMNERRIKNGHLMVHCPLRSMYAGTNLLNADTAAAAFWDRWHLRFDVTHLRDRDNIGAMIVDSLSRRASTANPDEGMTTITLAELDAAYDEALTVPVPRETFETYLDLISVMRSEGIYISDRRINDGFAAIMANAWLSGHDQVKVGDLAIVQHMFWSRREDAQKVRNVVLDACNPAEKAALDLHQDLNALTEQLNEAVKMDPAKRNGKALELFKKSQKIYDEGLPLRAKAMEGGASTIRIDNFLAQAEALKLRIGVDILNLLPEQVLTVKASR